MTEILPFDNAKKNHGLHVENLGKKYRKKRIISDISLTLFKGEVVALLGPNGAGKTTTFYAIAGLVIPENWKCFNQIISKSAEEKISLKAALEISPSYFLKGKNKKKTSKKNNKR